MMSTKSESLQAVLTDLQNSLFVKQGRIGGNMQ